jgi:signal-transduction protein with cAMP-binding, CBS, and nucleotidyltransferase domain
MPCPVCRFENFEGEDNCVNCGADLMGRDIPQPATEYHATVLGEHLDALGIGDFRTVAPGLPVADAIRLMHQEGTDCLLVVDGDRLVGIFTDRDAAVKAVDKRLGLYKVHDFMTPDPVVLRSSDTLAVAIHKMAVGEFRHIPVVDGARPIGVVAAADVFRHLAGALG